MGFFGNLFHSASESVALIDIGSGSVSGGYLSNGKNGPTLEYGVHVPVQAHDGEQLTLAMLRALSQVDDLLIKEGAPALRRATGSGRVGEVLVSVGSPWQDTSVRVERLEEAKTFTFTRALMRQVVERSTEVREGRIGSGESVIATRLNGYETNEPFGKEVKFADIIILSSTLDKTAADNIETALRKTYHTHRITFTAFAPCAYTVFRDVYPHEKNYLVIDVSGESTDIAFVQQNLLSSIISVPFGVNHLLRSIGTKTVPSEDREDDSKPAGIHIFRDTGHQSNHPARSEWIAGILEALKVFSEEHALPRSVFLLADDSTREYLQRALDDSTLRSLWLSDEPLSILPVLPSHFSKYIKTGAGGTSDVFLMMLALFHGKHIDDLRT